jgi:hypothetical protein
MNQKNIMNAKDIYVSLDEAREELKKRWNDVELKKRIEDELGYYFWPEFGLEPRSLSWNVIASPDNGFTFFYQSSKYINAKPLFFEFIGDMYISHNEMKKNLGRLHVQLENNEKATINITDLYRWNKKKISEIITKTEQSLVDFHHELFKQSGYDIEIKDKTAWVTKIGKPADWYYYYLLHFVAHGVLFEAYLSDGDERDDKFFNEIVAPAIERIKQRFKITPLIVKLYPERQSDDEDFYWWCFPPHVNDYIVDYARRYKLSFKKVNLGK